MAQQFKLPDGRNLDYLISGAKDGFPLIWIHGTPGSYLPIPSFSAVCEKKGVKVITASRAGYGGSTRKKGRRVVDAVPDLQALNEHLGVKQCIVGGWSGGGPHALACAARLPGCLAALSVAGGAPYDAEGLDFFAGQGEDNVQEFKAALKGEEELQEFCQAMRPDLLKADPAGLTETMSSILPDVDKQAMLENKEIGQFMCDMFQEGLKHNSDGWVDDDITFVGPWGFDLSEIKVPVFQYQGTEDKMVPVGQGEWIAKHLPQEHFRNHLMQGEGHISIFLGQMDCMIDELLAVAKAEQ
ncbi:MAG: hypothetical protein M1822_007518 [Bathelium mastoideum]|nr:MAG: hypothetical protein M1822_007518 [Bathelium mastoideum]